MSQIPVDLVAAHRHCVLHAEEIQASHTCGCFYCLAIFAPSDIDSWIDYKNVGEGREGRTALCPKCGIDSVIGSTSGFSITPEFLAAMQQRWFSSAFPQGMQH